MKLLAFAIHDSKAEAFLRPFFDMTKGSAVRSFADTVNEDGHPMNKHAEDYTLFHVGEFDQDMGKFVPAEPVSLGNAMVFKIAGQEDAMMRLEG